ncbi:hypothetical protein ERX46_15860 [Brumimicrobium glaciale]|uniref:Uncharacterized protein n=1 Tax=Brumimicrobium glaciale TaxID=200475 RepID=A0A4V1WF69_9FLAO|nr:hypothetical protein [Brumimicrobium glaciale]RYM32156.1 hypothetical protein ERX46_15860 [Brumimicrobium glaciale]
MIKEFEKNIYLKINFADRYLKIKDKYVRTAPERKVHKVPEMKSIMKKIEGHSYKYRGEGSHLISKEIDGFKVTYNIIMSHGILHFFIYVYEDDKIIGPSESLLGGVLHHIPYDKEFNQRIHEKFGYDRLEDVENYIHDIIDLLDSFTTEYCAALKEQGE